MSNYRFEEAVLDSRVRYEYADHGATVMPIIRVFRPVRGTISSPLVLHLESVESRIFFEPGPDAQRWLATKFINI